MPDALGLAASSHEHACVVIQIVPRGRLREVDLDGVPPVKAPLRVLPHASFARLDS